MTVAVRGVASYQQHTVEAGLRAALADIGFAESRPLDAIVEPGMDVFIKPNWVAHRYRASCAVQDSVWSTITHPSVILAVADLVSESLRGSGSITIGDNPSIDADFPSLIAVSGLEQIQDRYEVPVSLVDLRPLVCKDLADYGDKEKMVSQPGDPKGGAHINLGRNSLLYGMDPQRFRGVFDDNSDTVAAHTGETHLYQLSKSIVSSDVYISVPKLKTHHKVGTTLNLKGLVGSVLDKNQLVHWRVGYPEVGGDEYPSEEKWREGETSAVKKRGAWPGNDTIWRMVVDLYAALLQLRQGKPNLSVVDGVVGGQGEGPFCPRTKNAGVVMTGRDLLATDIAATRYMGFAPSAVPYLDHYLETGQIALDDISVVVDGDLESHFFSSPSRYADFEPPAAWQEVLA